MSICIMLFVNKTEGFVWGVSRVVLLRENLILSFFFHIVLISPILAMCFEIFVEKLIEIFI